MPMRMPMRMPNCLDLLRVIMGKVKERFGVIIA